MLCSFGGFHCVIPILSVATLRKVSGLVFVYLYFFGEIVFMNDISMALFAFKEDPFFANMTGGITTQFVSNFFFAELAVYRFFFGAIFVFHNNLNERSCRC